MRRLALLSLLLSTTALAQTRQPAQMTTTPTTTPQTFDVLDKTGAWVNLGTSVNGVFWPPTDAGGMDVRAAGCKSDGTDQAACINAAIAAAPDCVLIPPTPNGFYVAPGSTINATKCLKGAFYNPGVFASGYAGQPAIKCGTQTNSVCVKTTYNAAYLENLTITTAFPPAAGSIGLQIATGYNSQLRNINVSGFDTCAEWGPTGTPDGNGGLSSRAIGLNLTYCQTHFAVMDGWPELYITDGRWGSNGGSPATAPKDIIYITKSVPSGGGGGPNSLSMVNVQVNPGGGTVECMVRWGGFVGTGGQAQYWKFIGNHWEFLAPAPGSPAKKGVFCTDNTVPKLNSLYVSNTEFGFDLAGGGDVFALDPVTAVESLKIDNSYLSGDSTTLVFNAGGADSTANTISNSFLGGPLHLTGNSTRSLLMSNDITGAMTLDGTWRRFYSFGQITSAINDGAARGAIAIANIATTAWTPVVKFGGTPATLAYTGGGLMQRTANGGFWGTFNMVGPGSGTEGAVGNILITGMPYKCASGWVANPPWTQAGMAAGVGTLNLLFDSVDPVGIKIYKNTGAGFAQTTNADYTNAVNISATVSCNTAG